ncbi:PAS domain-containing sensor histidine kinase [Gluconobacter japonicus]|uniref:sensor histidine kinase NtrY-like n=1 Tax=Gluconobacter japonicus TaxID=376620 RepID=UPI0024AD4BCC|nr:PAS domain-containing sensor histidine kinase [Gluconobacter japonicus]MDI6652496.1 PAS domain-containing sensor histidine kinase [Gluconobacter japonicus]
MSVLSPGRLLRRLTSANGVVLLTVMALILAFATFVVLAGGMSLAHRPQVQAIIFLLDFIMLMLITAAGVVQIGRMLAERRLGLAGARLHARLITLFGIVAVAPTIVVGAVAALFFHYGVEIWFSNRVSNALTEARSVAAGYLQEHNDNIRTEAFALANTLILIQNDELFTHGTDLFHNPARLQELLDDEVYERGLTDAEVFDPLTNKVLGVGGLLGNTDMSARPPLPPKSVVEMARAGDVAILDRPDQRIVRAVVSLGGNSGLMLVITRPVDPEVLEHMRRTNELVQDYQRMISNRGKTQVTVVVIFGLMGLLVLAVGMLTGLALANRIANPLGLLILAATRISQGDLGVRVPVPAKSSREKDDEVVGLSRAFNRMTDQLESQRSELMQAYDQINERRRFTETVLAGVSAGVIGLDRGQVIELPNRAASIVLQRDLQPAIGTKLSVSVPEFSALLDKARLAPDRVHTDEIQVDTDGAQRPGGPGEGGGAGAGRTLLVRVVAELRGTDVAGYVVTFDDITALQSAQRKAAWADVARRVAHEIKNPLTPIQLAAERLKRRFLKEIQSDPDTYTQLVDTIVRQVGDIGRMVDEFSAFARMPQPVMQNEDFSRICREALVLQRNAHPNIVFETVDLPPSGPIVRCDRRLIGQALTNLLQNAADAIVMTGRGKPGENGPEGLVQPIGHIVVGLHIRDGHVLLGIEDDGIGLPAGERHRLTEPYVTHKAKGTGLGLAIVKKIMEDHAGMLQLTDRDPDPSNGRRGTLVTLSLPLAEPDSAGEKEGRIMRVTDGT